MLFQEPQIELKPHPADHWNYYREIKKKKTTRTTIGTLKNTFFGADFGAVPKTKNKKLNRKNPFLLDHKSAFCHFFIRKSQYNVALFCRYFY